MKKVIRTISGITPLAVMTAPLKCPGNCIYCPNQENIPKSYTTTSPVVLRAKDCDWDGYKQVKARMKIFNLMGHTTNKIELIVMGATFSAFPEDYQYKFIKDCFDGLNGTVSPTLKEAQKLNETSDNRCVTLCLETRPDYCKENNIDNFLDLGATRIEIGVQIPDNESYKLTNRGHTRQDVIDATQRLKDAGFKVGYHMMIGLPGSDPEKDLKYFKEIFTNPDFQPDQIKIYPTVVIKGTELESLYNIGKYKPYSTKEIIDMLVKIKQIVPDHVRIMRVMRDIPKEHIVSECFFSHLRSEVKEKLKELNLKCNCIRCREIGHREHDGSEIDQSFIKLKRKEYNASGGKEIFLSYEETKSNSVIALLRMRFPHKPARKEITEKSAIIREIHTYGPQVNINQKPKTEWQHRGYGKKLMEEAESIAKAAGKNKMIVIAGVGVKKYFIGLGYNYDGPYVSKKLI